jgi:indole-3-glycerol phosphate synthase
MPDFLDVLARDAEKTVREDYYTVEWSLKPPPVSLKKSILECRYAPIISEVKTVSPSSGIIRENVDVESVSVAMESGGVIGISVLTEPKHFGGTLESFAKIRRAVKLPLLMKDIIISFSQLEAAAKIGVNAVLLIESLFERNYCECDVHEMIEKAQSKGLEVLLESHTEKEFLTALHTKADLVGINNRNLRTLKVDLNATERILLKNDPEGKIVVSESGIKTPGDIRFLHNYGAHAFLIGTVAMRADNVERKIREFVTALGNR